MENVWMVQRLNQSCPRGFVGVTVLSGFPGRRQDDVAQPRALARLDTMVTVVDAVSLLRDCSSHDLTTRPNWVAELSLAGAMSSVTPPGG